MRMVVVALAALLPVVSAWAQPADNILRILHRDSPGSLSIHEETSNSAITPIMGVFNNLVMYDQHVAQNSAESIVPDLGRSWTWDPSGTRLTFRLQSGVKWHDGKPFTSADVKCTWDRLIGKSTDKLRFNVRESWYTNLSDVTTDGDLSVTFHLKRPQASFLAFLASGYSPVYPCHVPAADMRSKPVGTGPFRFVEYKRNEYIRLTRNPDYWKPGLPKLDGVEFTIIPNRSTAVLSFVAGKFDMTFPYEVTIPLLKDITTAAPAARCEIAANNVSTNLLVNRTLAPFDKPEIHRAMALAINRQPFIDIISEGKSAIGGALLPPPEGVWGIPAGMMNDLPGYGDPAAGLAEAQQIMKTLGYGPGNPLRVKIAARNVAAHRDPAVILIEQLSRIYIEGEMELIESAVWPSRLAKRDYSIALNLTGSGGDDPDIVLYDGYYCSSNRNFGGYCNKAIDALIDQQSAESDIIKRKRMVLDIDRRLQQDNARPIIFQARSATCIQPWVKNMTIMVNSMYNGWRFEDVSIER